MDIEISKAGRLNLDISQQVWNGDNIMQTSIFAGQEMMAIQMSDEEPNNYELHYLGLMVSGFNDINDAKNNAPSFAMSALEVLSTLINLNGKN